MSKLSNCLQVIELLHIGGEVQIHELAEELDVKDRMLLGFSHNINVRF